MIFMTNRQFAEMIASGKYEWMHSPSNSGVVYHAYWYLEKDKDKEINIEDVNHIVIRRYDQNDWVEPKLELYREFKRGQDNFIHKIERLQGLVESIRAGYYWDSV